MPEFGFTSSFSALSYKQDKGVEIGVNRFVVSVGSFLFASVALSSAQPVFGPPVNLGPKINSSAHESDPFLTADGKKLFFVRGLGIWYSEWTDTGWTEAQILPPPINVGASFKQSPSLSPDGQKLYYVNSSLGGYSWDIWVSTWDSSVNNWGAPVNLGWPVNTPGEEFTAKIGPDGRHLYFSSVSDPDSFFPGGRCGIYMSEWNDTNWSVPLLQWGSCTPESPSVPADGQWLYFDNYVSDGKSTFVAGQQDSDWVLPAYDLRPQIGERSGTPFITPSGESLFVGSGGLLGGFGGRDIFLLVRIPTGVDDNHNSNRPRAFDLHQNYPNPFNGQTRIPFFISQTVNKPVELLIYNLLGQPIRHLIRNETAKGKRELVWDGTDDNGKEVASGLYLIRLKVGNESVVKKATFLK